MATNFFNTKWSDRPPLERTIILGSTITLIVFGAIKGKQIVENIKLRRQQKTLESDLGQLQQYGKNPSYQDSQYFIFADIVYQAMKGLFTDEVSVAGVMYKMKNDADILKLIQSFGKKDGYTLAEWIADDFNNEDKQFYINNVLAKKGIKYRF